MVRNYIRKTDRGLTYSREQLREAIEKVRSGECNGYEAAVRYKIPRTTLYDHVTGKGGKSHTLGKPPVLSAEIEKILLENLKQLQDNGFNLGRKDVLDLVGLYINSNNMKNPFRSGKPGECWLMAFCKRHDFNPKPLYKEFGVKERDVIIVKDFYSLLEMRINEFDLSDKPGQIWYIEEHSFYKGKRVPRDDKHKDITFVTAYSAEGKKAPLLTVFKGEKSHDWMLGKHINVSHSRGMCAEVFKDYFQTVFLNYIDDSRPNLVILEAQSSLIDLDLIAEAKKSKVTMLKCPRYLEGLDMAIAKTLKLRVSTPFNGTSKEFSNFMADIFDGVQVSEIQEDFKNAGIHPFATVPDGKFDDDRLKVYEDYIAFKERHLNSSVLNDPEEVIIKEDMEFQENFEMEIDESSTSMSMTDELESSGSCSSQLLRHALIAVKKGLTVMETVPMTSINDEILQIHSEDSGTTADKELVAWITNLNNAGFAVTEENLAEAVLSKERASFKTTPRESSEGFLKRHPELRDKISKHQSQEEVTAESLRVWLGCVKRYLKKIDSEDTLNSPRRLFSFGEAGLYLKPEDQALESENVTVLATASAEGEIQTPSVIFPFKLPNALVSSWTKAEILADHITENFYPWLIDHNVSFPVILFMDRTTHINLSLSKFLKEQQIIPIALMSTEIQPLESVFRLLKVYFKQNNSNMIKIRKEAVAKELESYVNRDFGKEITESFNVCGLYPFNPNIKYINETENAKKLSRIDSEKHNDTNVNLLEEIEKRITKEVLEEFKKSDDSWQGDPVHSSLFDFWKRIREEYLKKDTRMEIEHSVTLDGNIFEIFIEDAAAQLRNF